MEEGGMRRPAQHIAVRRLPASVLYGVRSIVQLLGTRFCTVFTRAVQ